MKIERFVFIIISAAAMLCMLFLFNSCQHEGISAEQLDEICFTEQVLPIFQNSCGTSGCHDTQTANHRYVYTDYARIMKSITPGNADQSPAYKAIISKFEIMPPNNPLPPEKRIIIRQWIEQGAKQTNCGTMENGTKQGTSWACYDRDIKPILMSSCAVSGCHDAISRKKEIDFSSYTQTFKMLKAGNPNDSKLYEVITKKQPSEDLMPPKPYSPLSQAAIDSIYSWIKRGALNEICESSCDTTGTITYSGHIKSIIELSCVSCHGNNSPSGGVKLLTAADVQAVTKSGKLIGAIKRMSGFKAMPPTYTLAVCEIKQIELWKNQGYN